MVKKGRFTKEAQFQAWLKMAAKVNGWLYYHTYRSDRSEAGFPDTVMVHSKKLRLIFAELKVGRNKTSVAQQTWLDSLRRVYAHKIDAQGTQVTMPEVYLWDPADEDEIVEILGGKRPIC